MSEITYPIRVICAHGTEQEWADANPILKKGEIGVSYDGSEGPRLKVGDGVNEWNDLLWMVADVSATFDFADNFRIGVPNGGTGQTTFTPGFLKANGTNPFSTVSNIIESDLSFSDVTTGNASTTKHGFLPKLNNDDSYFLSGKGTWAVPEYMYPTGISGSSSGSVLSLSIGYRSNLSSDVITTSAYNLTGATDSAAGLVTTGAQTFAGIKTFNNGIISDVTGDVTGNSNTSTTIRTVISTPSDLNSILTPGEYYIPQSTVQNTTLNIPSDLSSSDGLVIRVYEPVYTSGTSTYGLRFVQFAIGSSSGNVYVRTITRPNTSSTFTYNSWKQLNFKSDVDNILNGTTTFAGTKTFTSSIIGNLTGNVTGNADTASMLDFTSVNTDATSKDLNNYITPGLYVFENISSTNLLNSPVPEGYTSSSYIKGFLEVFNIKKSPTDSNALVGFQRFTIHRYTSSDNKMAKTYIRGFSKSSSTNISDMTIANNFTPWKTFLDENDISPLETSITNITNGTTTVEYANKLKLTLLSSNSLSANLNEVIEPGLYYGYYTTSPTGSGISHTNFPSDFPSGVMYYMYVNNYNYGTSTSYSYIIQRLYSKDSTGGVVYIRNLSYDESTNPPTTSGTWLKIATNSDISNILTGNITFSGTKTFSSNIVGNLTGNVTGNVTGVSDKATSLTYTEIPNENSNLNDYVASGLYVCVGSTSTVQNVPPRPTSYSGGIRFYMEVLNRNEPNANGYIGLQIFRWTYGNSNLNSIYYRQFNYSSGNLTFFDWIKVTDSIDFDPVKNNVDNILNGTTTFAGTKTFSSNIVGNLTGNSDTATMLNRQNVEVTDQSTANLNDYYIPGLYNFYYATSSRLLNSPIPDTLTGSHCIRAFVEVFSNNNNPTTANSVCGFQRITLHGLSSASSTLKKFAKTYVRGFYKQSSDAFSQMTFTEWKSLLDQNDISSLESSVSNILDGTTTFAGDKTFSSTIIGNISGNSGTADRLKLRYVVGTSKSCDLNNIIEPGLHYGYYAASPSSGTTYSNFPSDFPTNDYVYLYIDNYNYGDNTNQNGIIQRLYSKKTGDIYIRGLAYNASQSPVSINPNSWTKVAKTSEIDTLSETVSTLSTSLSTLSTGLSNRGIYTGAAALNGNFDFNDKVSQGIYYVNNTSGTITNYPGPAKSLGWLYVIGTSGATYTLQIFVRAVTSPDKSTIYYRYRRSVSSVGTWTSWFKLTSDSDSTFLDNITFLSSSVGGVDLDDYVNQGVYGFVGGNVTGTGAANFPTTVGGILLVFGNGGTNTSQLYIGTASGGMWYRSGSFSNSSPTWRALIDGGRNNIVKVDQTGGTSLKLPNYPARTYEYCVYEFDSTTKAFSNMFCGTAVGNTDMTGSTVSSSKLYKGWYRRIF